MSSSLERARASASAARAEARLQREAAERAQAQLVSASDDRSELRAQVSQLEAAAVAAAQAVQRTERKEREAREEAERAQECGVCLCERKTHMFTPCGHKCVCEGCADELLRRGDRCPVCRAALEGAVRVFD